MYTWLSISRPEDFDQLESALEGAYAPSTVAKLLKGHVSPQCAGVLIESMYVDKDYRSTYYNFYAKKGLSYDPFCVRLHFFDAEVTFRPDALELVSQRGDVSGHYFGFMVLRPTTIATVGRSVLSPQLLERFQGRIIGAWHKVHILGLNLKVWGFPWMFQHRDIAVCAHVACWSILRHYSERYSAYAEHLTHEITRMAYGFDPGGIVPSRGLTLLHAERVFSSARTYPVMIAKAKKDTGSFFRSLIAYVESGFPLFAAIPSERHAIAVIGHGPMTEDPGAGANSQPLYYAADLVAELIVSDDNVAPYRSISRARGSSPKYSIDDLEAFIVPLPDKVFYPAESVDTFALKLTESGYFGISIAPDETPVIRYFLTTGAAYRRFIAEHRSEFPQPLISVALQLPMTQFIWVIEVSTTEQWARRHISFRAVLDATASLTDNNPLFLIHDDKRAVVVDRMGGDDPREFVFPVPISVPFGRMPDDLHERR